MKNSMAQTDAERESLSCLSERLKRRQRSSVDARAPFGTINSLKAETGWRPSAAGSPLCSGLRWWWRRWTGRRRPGSWRRSWPRWKCLWSCAGWPRSGGCWGRTSPRSSHLCQRLCCKRSEKKKKKALEINVSIIMFGFSYIAVSCHFNH